MRCARFRMRVGGRHCILCARLCRILPRVLRSGRAVVRMARTRRRRIGRAAMRRLALLLSLRLPLFLSLPMFLSLPLLLRRGLRVRAAAIAAALRTALLALSAAA